MTAFVEPVPATPAATGSPAQFYALWEITAVENFDEVVTFFAVTDLANRPPDVRAAYDAVRSDHGTNFLSRVHSVRLVTRVRSEVDAGRLAGLVVTEAISDQRARVVSPRDLGAGA